MPSSSIAHRSSESTDIPVAVPQEGRSRGRTDLGGLPDVLKVPEVAEILRVDRKTIYDLIDRGELGAIRVGRRGLVRIPKAMLRSYLEGRAALTGGIHASTT
jgi:excisionase family DNA binding protein